MAAHDKEYILTALNSRLYTFQSSNVAVPGGLYKRQANTPYLQVRISFVVPMNATLGENGGENEHRGIYQIDVYYPYGAGWKDAVKKADGICTLFKRGTSMSSGGVTVRVRRCGPEHVMEEDGWLRIPITIEWFAFIAN